MNTRETQAAITELRAAGYNVVPYPDAMAPTNLIVQQHDVTVTTLPVADGGVCDASVAYLVSEAHYGKLAEPRI